MLGRIWSLLCSLKLTIWLASITTLLLMGGSLLVPFYPEVFGSMDRVPFASWLEQAADTHLQLSWWFLLAALGMCLLGINTLSCFVDWLSHIRSRWRKTGEYLLHLGVVVVLLAYIWGSLAGWRIPEQRLDPGSPVPIDNWPGYALRLDQFTPIFSGNGPPQDMISYVTLLEQGQEKLTAQVSVNRPLLHNGLVVTPVSFGQAVVGLRFIDPKGQSYGIRAGSQLELLNGTRVDVLRFLPDIQGDADNNRRFSGRARLGVPAFEIRVTSGDEVKWRGWYLPSNGIPRPLRLAGFDLRPAAPLTGYYSILTINYDPGAGLALIGGLLITGGALLSLVSFYRKRARNERPEI